MHDFLAPQFDTICTIAAILGGTIALWRLIGTDLHELRGGVSGIRKYTASVEGLLNGYIRRPADGLR